MNRYSVSKLPLDILLEVAGNHRQLRKSMKITQEELAQRTGVSLGSIKRFEQTGHIGFMALLKLAQALGRLPDFEPVFRQEEDLKKVELLFSDKMRNQ